MIKPTQILTRLLLLAIVHGIPAQFPVSAQTPVIPEPDRIRLAEAFRLSEELQDKVWPGWSQAPFTVLLVTPEWEFLLQHPKPSDDFQPAGHDPLLKTAVYRRKLVFSTDLLATFPAVNGVSTVVIGQAEITDAKGPIRWVVTLFHEHFHQCQDSQPGFFSAVNALGLSHGDTSGMWMLNFPFPYRDSEINRRFSELSGLLAGAMEARATPEFAGRQAAYRAAWKRFTESLAAEDCKYLEFQLWKEGVARYIEYRGARLGAEHFHPSPAFQALPVFRPFSDDAKASLERIQRELRTMKLQTTQRAAFYAVGAAEALLLDAVDPRWHERYYESKLSLGKRSEKQASSNVN